MVAAAGALRVHPGRHGGALDLITGLVYGQGGVEDVVVAVEEGGLVDAPADARGRATPLSPPCEGGGGAGGIALPTDVHRVLKAAAARRVVQGQVHGGGGGQVQLLHLAGGERSLVDDQLVHLASEGDGGVAVGPMAAVAQVEVDARLVLAGQAIVGALVIALPIKDVQRHAGRTVAELLPRGAGRRAYVAEQVVAVVVALLCAMIVLPRLQDVLPGDRLGHVHLDGVALLQAAPGTVIVLRGARAGAYFVVSVAAPRQVYLTAGRFVGLFNHLELVNIDFAFVTGAANVEALCA